MRSDTYWRIADKKGKLPFLVLGPFGGSNSEKSKMYMGVHLYTGGTYNPGFTVISSDGRTIPRVIHESQVQDDPIYVK